MLGTALSAAASVGLGCGTCCGTTASSFLAVYILSEGGGFISSLKHVGGFFVGKILAVCTITTLCAAIGSVFIDENGYIGGFDLHHAMSWIMLLSSLYLIWKWFRERQKTCASCGGKCSSKSFSRVIPSFTVGLAYGATPCAPLLMVAGYAITLSVPGALLLGTVFALASSLSPVLLIFGLSGVLSGKIRSQLGRVMPWIQLGVYILFFILAVISLFWYN